MGEPLTPRRVFDPRGWGAPPGPPGHGGPWPAGFSGHFRGARGTPGGPRGAGGPPGGSPGGVPGGPRGPSGTPRRPPRTPQKWPKIGRKRAQKWPKKGRKIALFCPCGGKAPGGWGGSAHYPHPTAQSDWTLGVKSTPRHTGHTPGGGAGVAVRRGPPGGPRGRPGPEASPPTGGQGARAPGRV